MRTKHVENDAACKQVGSEAVSWPSSNGLFQKKTKQSGGRSRGYGISRGIKEIAKGICKGYQEKLMWNFQGSWWFGLEISKGSNAILWNFQGWGFVLSGISRVKVKEIKNSRGLSKKYAPCWFFSEIAQSMIRNEFHGNQTE